MNADATAAKATCSGFRDSAGERRTSRQRCYEGNDANAQVDAGQVPDEQVQKMSDVRETARRDGRVAANGCGHVPAGRRSGRAEQNGARRDAEQEAVLSQGLYERTACAAVTLPSQQHSQDRGRERCGPEDDELHPCKDCKKDRSEEQRIAPQTGCPDRLEHRPDAHETERVRQVLAHRERRVAHDGSDDGEARHDERQSAR